VLISCVESYPIGHVRYVYKWDCVKTGISAGPSVGMNGKLGISTHSYCKVSKCFEYKITRQKWIDDQKKIGLVDDNKCLGEK